MVLTDTNFQFPESFWSDFAQNKWAILDTRTLIPQDKLIALKSEIQKKKDSSFFKKAGIGHSAEIQNHIRGDFIYWIQNQDEFEKLCFEFLNELKMNLNKEFFLNLKDFEAHYAVYPPGTFYEKHLDVFHSPKVLQLKRTVSFILYLNPEWTDQDGGELVLYNQDNDHIQTLKPSLGKCVIFMSDTFPHEVLTIKNKERFSLTAWFLA